MRGRVGDYIEKGRLMTIAPLRRKQHVCGMNEENEDGHTTGKGKGKQEMATT